MTERKMMPMVVNDLFLKVNTGHLHTEHQQRSYSFLPRVSPIQGSGNLRCVRQTA